jgi:hypothetical protein
MHKNKINKDIYKEYKFAVILKNFEKLKNTEADIEQNSPEFPKVY